MCTDFSAISICFVAVRFDIALNKHILCVCVNTDSADSATVRHIWTLRESYDQSGFTSCLFVRTQIQGQVAWTILRFRLLLCKNPVKASRHVYTVQGWPKDSVTVLKV